MSFIESPRFPDAISYGAAGGPEYSTDVVVSASGYEQRNQNWSQSRLVWDVAHGAKDQADLYELIKFFRLVKGRAIGFRFRDPLDHSATSLEGVFRAIDATHHQMVKRYALDGNTVDRDIRKPVDSAALTINGSGTYTVDFTTGIVTTVSGSAPATWEGEFDVPCRFDTDTMRATITSYSVYDWGQIPVKEIRV